MVTKTKWWQTSDGLDTTGWRTKNGRPQYQQFDQGNTQEDTQRIANPNNRYGTQQMPNPQPKPWDTWTSAPGAMTYDPLAPPTGQQGNPLLTAVNAGSAAAAQAAQGGTGAGYTVAQKTGTSGRTGASYAQFLAQHPDFDPWVNLDTYAGKGAGNDPILAQALAWTNQWATANGYGDGSLIPLQQKQQIFFSNLERARQQWADYTVDGQSHPGAITWEQSAASRIPNQGWAYEAGWGLTHPGQAYQAPQGASAAGSAAGNAVTSTMATNYGAGTTNGQNGTGAAAQNGAGTVSAPNYGTGLGAGAAAAGSVGATGQGVNPSGVYGNAAEMVANNPDQAYMIYQRMRGQDPTVHGKFESYLRQKIGGQLTALIASKINGAGQTLGNLDDIIKGYIGAYQPGANLYGYLADAGQQGLAGGTDFMNAADQSVAERYAMQMAGLQSQGYGALGQSAVANTVGDTNDAYTLEALLNGGQNTSKYGNFLKGSPTYDLLARLYSQGRR